MFDNIVNAHLLERFFSIVVTFDNDWVVSSSSRVFKKYVRAMDHAVRISDLFSIHRPANIRRTDDLRACQGELFLLVSRERDFAIRGEILEINSEEGTTFCLYGSPWLAWMNANRPDIDLSINDFGNQDAQLDLLFLMSTEKHMVSDLERLNVDLKIARDAAESADSAKSDFLAVMSHEMRTPLNAIVSAISLLEDKDLAPESAKLVGLAHHSCHDLLTIINYALDSAKVESGQFELEHSVFHVRESVTTVADVLRAKAAEKGLELECVIAAEVPEWCNADITKIRQILVNFVSNAIKFTERGKVVVRVTGSASDVRPYRLRFEVEDTGSGIPQEYHEKVFDAFWSSNLRVSNTEAGTGLGLDISKRLVEIIRGEIGFDSQVDKGSTFWFEAPVELVENAHAAAVGRSGTARSAPVPALFKGRVLLADDNQTNVLLGRMMLEKFGVRVETVSDGREAVEMVHAVPFDLILMDITMPVMDGIEATDRIREKPDCRNLPIVALTAHVSPEERDRCLAHGMSDFLSKPIDRVELARVLNDWLPPDDGGNDLEQSTCEATDDSDAVIEESTLQRLLQDIGVDGFRLVVDSFRRELEERKRALSMAWGADAHDDIAREAHTLIGSARSFGAIDLAVGLEAIESAAKKHAPKSATQEMLELDRKCRMVADALDHFARETASRPTVLAKQQS